MTIDAFDAFIKKYEGKEVDVDKYPKDNPFQCTDLFRLYVKEVLHLPQPKSVQGAKDFWLKKDPIIEIHFTKIPNTLKNIPQKGDAIIWDKWRGNKFGHVAIFIEGDVNKFISLDQNFPTLSKVTKTTHTYLRPKVLGWLRAKNMELDPEADIPSDVEKSLELKSRKWYNKHWSWKKLIGFVDDETRENDELDKELEKLRIENTDIRRRHAQIASTLSERDKRVTSLEQQQNALRNEITLSKAKAEHWEAQSLQLSTEAEEADEESDKLRAEIKKCKPGGVNDLDTNKLQKAWNRLPKEIKVALYLLTSAIIGQVIISLTDIQTDNVIMLMVANIALVFLRQLKPRVDAYRSKK